jgi:hypothetical protein
VKTYFQVLLDLVIPENRFLAGITWFENYDCGNFDRSISKQDFSKNWLTIYHGMLSTNFHKNHDQHGSTKIFGRD